MRGARRAVDTGRSDSLDKFHGEESSSRDVPLCEYADRFPSWDANFCQKSERISAASLRPNLYLDEAYMDGSLA
jgi:hypothetical protein